MRENIKNGRRYLILGQNSNIFSHFQYSPPLRETGNESDRIELHKTSLSDSMHLQIKMPWSQMFDAGGRMEKLIILTILTQESEA
jgi:hypothetical protein